MVERISGGNRSTTSPQSTPTKAEPQDLALRRTPGSSVGLGCPKPASLAERLHSLTNISKRLTGCQYRCSGSRAYNLRVGKPGQPWFRNFPDCPDLLPRNPLRLDRQAAKVSKGQFLAKRLLPQSAFGPPCVLGVCGGFCSCQAYAS